MNDDVENEKWVLQKLFSSVETEKYVQETWQTVSKPLPYRAASERLARYNDGSRLYRLLTGVECSLGFRSMVQDTVPFVHHESLI